VPNTHPALVTQALFEAAQKVIVERGKNTYSEDTLLARLETLLKQHGRLSGAIVRDDAHPTPHVYIRKFGGLRNAYAQIGYKQPLDCQDIAAWTTRRGIENAINASLSETLIRDGRAVQADGWRRILIVDEVHLLAVTTATYMITPVKHQQVWFLRTQRKSRITLTIVPLLGKDNASVAEYLILPRALLRTSKQIHLHKSLGVPRRSSVCPSHRGDSSRPIAPDV
jgi:hypothetical protein